MQRLRVGVFASQYLYFLASPSRAAFHPGLSRTLAGPSALDVPFPEAVRLNLFVQLGQSPQKLLRKAGGENTFQEDIRFFFSSRHFFLLWLLKKRTRCCD